MNRPQKTNGVVMAAFAACLCLLLYRADGLTTTPLPMTEGAPTATVARSATPAAEEPKERETLRPKERAPAAAGWIRGCVVDAASGVPIVGADVRLAATATSVTRMHATVARTSEDGRFCLSVLVRGKERLEVRAPGRDPRVLPLDGMGPRVDLGDVFLFSAEVAGLRVIDANGAPVPGAAVFWRVSNHAVVWGSSAHPVGSGLTFELERPTAITDRDGCAALPEATFGVHRLLVVRDGFRCHLRDVPITEDTVRDLGTVVLETAPAVEIALVREDGGEVRAAAVHMEVSSSDTLALSAKGATVRLPPPPTGEPRVDASAYEVDGTFWGQLEASNPRVVMLRLKVPAVSVHWQAAADAEEPVTLWCFAVQRGTLWEQACAVRSLRDGTWHCWPRRGPDVRFVAWSPRSGLGTADATSRRGPNGRDEIPTLKWRSLPRRALRITADDRPAVDAVVVGDVELTDEVVGTAIGGTQRPRTTISGTSDRDGVADLGAVGGLRISVRVTLAGYPPVDVQLDPNGPEETPVRLASGGTIVARISDTPLRHRGLRLGIQTKARTPRWFPVTGTEMRLEDIEIGPADVILDVPAELGPSLEPPVLDVRAIGHPDATIELDRVSVVVGPAPVWADLSVARPSAASVSVTAPTALRLAVTPVGAHSLPKQRAFVSVRSSAVSRVRGLFDGKWLVELLDADLRTVWWCEIEVSRTPLELSATLPTSRAAVDGGPAEAQGVLSAQLHDGRAVPWLEIPLRISEYGTVIAVPEGRYHAELKTSEGAWHGHARVEARRVSLTPASR